MLQKIRKFLTQKGQGVVEYALLLGVVAVIVAILYDGVALPDAFATALRNILEKFLIE